MRKLVFGAGVIALISIFFACENAGSSKYPGFEEVNGMYAKTFVSNETGREVMMGDIVSMSMIYSIDDDSVLLDTRLTSTPVKLRADSGQYEGDIMGAFVGMHVGDSACFIVDASDFFIKTAGAAESPYFIDSTSTLYFYVKILETLSEDEMMLQEQKLNADAASVEMEVLQNYLTENGIDQTPTESGLIVIRKSPGNGKMPKVGDRVSVDYEGRLIDGTYFDSSVEEVAKEQGLYNEARTYEPYAFTLGKGEVIRGWDEGVALLSEGEKATFIIPSSLAYGANPRPGVIKPFNTLIFEVQLAKIGE